MRLEDLIISSSTSLGKRLGGEVYMLQASQEEWFFNWKADLSHHLYKQRKAGTLSTGECTRAPPCRRGNKPT